MKKTKFYGIVIGIAATLITAGYFLAITALPRVDNPGSTQGVAYVFMILYTLFGGLVGIVAGSLLGWILDSALIKTGMVKNEKNLRKLVCSVLIGTFIIVAIAMYMNTKRSQEEYNIKNTQEVKFNAGNIEKIQVDAAELKNYNLGLNAEHAIGRIGADYYSSEKEFKWNGNDYIISSDDNNHLYIKNSDGSILIDHSLEGYNYITGISYVVYEKNEKSNLFVLSRLRATSHMSVLNVFSEKGELLYEELMGRFNIIEFGELNGKKVIVIGNSQPRANEIIVSLADFIYSIKD